MLSGHVKKLPIFMGHGTADPMLKFEFGKGSADYLKSELGFATVASGQVRISQKQCARRVNFCLFL